MIRWDIEYFLQNGFESLTEEGSNYYCLLYKTDKLIYQLIIDEENDRVAISGDFEIPFGGDSLYEIYVSCKAIEYRDQQEIDYRLFHFSFYDCDTPDRESMTLTVSGRQSDSQLVVWPYKLDNEKF